MNINFLLILKFLHLVICKSTIICFNSTWKLGTNNARHLIGFNFIQAVGFELYTHAYIGKYVCVYTYWEGLLYGIPYMSLII